MRPIRNLTMNKFSGKASRPDIELNHRIAISFVSLSDSLDSKLVKNVKIGIVIFRFEFQNLFALSHPCSTIRRFYYDDDVGASFTCCSLFFHLQIRLESRACCTWFISERGRSGNSCVYLLHFTQAAPNVYTHQFFRRKEILCLIFFLVVCSTSCRRIAALGLVHTHTVFPYFVFISILQTELWWFPTGERGATPCLTDY